MANLLEIITIGNPILKNTSEEVVDFNSIRELCEDMIESLPSNGVGLAAPQVGQNLRIFVAKLDNVKRVFINPKFIEKSDEFIDGYEGCLSIPGYLGKVNRHKWVKIGYYTLDKEYKEEVFQDFQARIMQHESDHLDGIVYLEKVFPINSLSTKDSFAKYIKNPQKEKLSEPKSED